MKLVDLNEDKSLEEIEHEITEWSCNNIVDFRKNYNDSDGIFGVSAINKSIYCNERYIEVHASEKALQYQIDMLQKILNFRLSVQH